MDGRRHRVVRDLVDRHVLVTEEEIRCGIAVAYSQLRTVAEGVLRLADEERSFLIITHYQRVLDYVTPHHIHVLVDGTIGASGGPELAEEIETTGYDAYRETPAEPVA